MYIRTYPHVHWHTQAHKCRGTYRRTQTHSQRTMCQHPRPAWDVLIRHLLCSSSWAVLPSDCVLPACRAACVRSPAGQQPLLRHLGTARAAVPLPWGASLPPPDAEQLSASTTRPELDMHRITSVTLELAVRAPTTGGVQPISAGTKTPAVSKPSSARTTTFRSQGGLPLPQAAVLFISCRNKARSQAKSSLQARPASDCKSAIRWERRSPAVRPVAVSAPSRMPKRRHTSCELAGTCPGLTFRRRHVLKYATQLSCIRRLTFR